MLNKMKSFCLSAVLASFVIGTAGCVPLIIGAAAGVGGYAWVKGTLTKQFDTTAVQLYQATLKGLNELDLSVQDDEHDRLSAKIVSEFSNGKSIKININALTERVARIKIRVGILGDKSKSEMILNSIQAYL